MEPKYHYRNADGTYSPSIVDPMGDTAMADKARVFLVEQRVERSVLEATGENVR